MEVTDLQLAFRPVDALRPMNPKLARGAVSTAEAEADSATAAPVVVAGGGPAGVAAALAAARSGAEVILVEYFPVLGGMGTAGLVNNFCGGFFDQQRFIIGGIFAEVRAGLIARGALYETCQMEPYEPDAYHRLLADLLAAAGVRCLHGHKIASCRELADGSLALALDDGRELAANAVVDATGDAVVAAMAGVPRRKGRDKDGAVMPLTMCYRFTGLDLDAAQAGWPNFVDPRNQQQRPVYTDPNTGERNFFHSGHSAFIDPMIVAERAAGRLSIPRDHVAVIQGVPGCPGDATVNFGRVFVNDPTDPVELARATREAEDQVHDGIAFFRRCLPGFANIRLVSMARTIGVRQSFQIEGLYRLTQDDCLALRQFDDVIAQCCYMVDIHEPGSDTTTCITLPPGSHYDIPWRCLVPASGPARLIAAGRCISADAGAMASLRVQAPSMAIGQAAGTGAAIAAAKRIPLRQLDPALVQQHLRAAGAILD